MSKPVLVFDMDGVMVDVSESYRETIARTVEHFTGRVLGRAEIQDYKNQGGFNDDWKLSHTAITRAGVDVPFQDVVDYFQSMFHGANGQDGLILRERWLADDGLFERLSERFQLAIFTGRYRWEAELTLRRFTAVPFAPILGMSDVPRLKPYPDGLLQIEGCAWYVGDTVDDARCARAANVPFIGIAAESNPRYREALELFRQERAAAVLEDINGLETVLAAKR